MLKAILYRLMVAATIFAFLGGMTLQLMPPKEAFAAPVAAKMDGDCPHMAMPPHALDGSRKTPCKGMDSECVKQMGCLGTASLPLPAPSPPTVFAYSKIAYWVPRRHAAGRSIKPDLFPPIGL